MTRATFTEQEMQLRLQQASLEAERACLEVTLTKLAIEARAEILEAAAYPDSVHSRHSNVHGLEEGPWDTLQRTAEYVYQHSISGSQTAPETKDVNRDPNPMHHTEQQEADLRSQFYEHEDAERRDKSTSRLAKELGPHPSVQEVPSTQDIMTEEDPKQRPLKGMTTHHILYMATLHQTISTVTKPRLC